MSKKDYLICGNEYNSYNKTRGVINRVLKDLEKQFRDNKFATSQKGSVALAVTSFFAAQMLKLESAVLDETDDPVNIILKELMDMTICTKEGQQYFSENTKN